jgi:putative FmdB family regulatory protein
MPAYDFRCRTCDAVFEVRRGLDEVAAPVACPQGHAETSRVFTPVSVGGAAGGAAASAEAPAGGGGCCGGGCCG